MRSRVRLYLAARGRAGLPNGLPDSARTGRAPASQLPLTGLEKKNCKEKGWEGEVGVVGGRQHYVQFPILPSCADPCLLKHAVRHLFCAWPPPPPTPPPLTAPAWLKVTRILPRRRGSGRHRVGSSGSTQGLLQVPGHSSSHSPLSSCCRWRMSRRGLGAVAGFTFGRYPCNLPHHFRPAATRPRSCRLARLARM